MPHTRQRFHWTFAAAALAAALSFPVAAERPASAVLRLPATRAEAHEAGPERAGGPGGRLHGPPARSIPPLPPTYTDWPRIPSPIPLDPAMEARIATIVAGMTLEQKVGQMTQADAL